MRNITYYRFSILRDVLTVVSVIVLTFTEFTVWLSSMTVCGQQVRKTKPDWEKRSERVRHFLFLQLKNENALNLKK